MMAPDDRALCITKEGYQAVIISKENEFQATIIDRSMPRCLQITQIPVAFASPYTIADTRNRNRHWQQTHIQLVRFNNSRILFVGKLGLSGGFFWKSFHVCSWYGCNPYRCERCNYTCPNKACFDQCGHRSDHQCASRQAAQQREQEERQERARRAQEERERQERVRREQEERVRLQREREARQRERQEQLRVQREREEQQRQERERQELLKRLREQEERERQQRIEKARQERARRERLERERVQREQEEQRRKEEQRKREERERQERLEQQRIERERQERIRRESEERERQERLRVLREQEEKEAITNKLDEALLATSAIQDTETDYVSEDEEVEIKKESNRTETNAIQQEGPIENVGNDFGNLSPDLAVVPYRLLFETLGVEKDLLANKIDDSFNARDMKTAESWYKEITIVKHERSNLINSILKRLESNMSSDFNRMIDIKLKIRAEKEAYRKNRQIKTGKDRPKQNQNQRKQMRKEAKQKRNHRKQLQREAKLRETMKDVAFRQLSRVTRRNLRNASVELLQNILEYVHRGGKLQIRVVKRFSVFRWIEQSLIVEVVSFPDGNVDTVLQHVFTDHWLELKSLYEWQQRRELLYSLRTKQLGHNLTLGQINDILSMVCKLQNKGLQIICKEECFWYRKLKRYWLKTKIVRKDCDEETMDGLVEALIDLPWNCLMLEQFVSHIVDRKNQRGIRDMLSIIVNEHVAYPIVMNVVTTQAIEGSNCVQYWLQELKYQLFIYNIYKKSPSVSRVVDEKLGILLRTTNIGPSLKCFIEENVSKLEQSLPLLATVLEHVYTSKISVEQDEPTLALACHKVTTTKEKKISVEKWDKVFNILRTNNPTIWVEKIDQMIVSNSFGDNHEYSLEDLINKINQGAPDLAYTRRENLMMAFEAVDRCYNSKAQSLASDSSAFSHFVSNSAFITVTNVNTLQKIIQKPVSDWKETEIRLWAAFVKSNPKAANQNEIIAVIKRAVELVHKYPPRTVQLLSLLVLANPTESHGRLAQINTGEGKSLIVAMLAALHTLKGEQVDVVTTSTELSIPEVKKQRPFFELLNLTVDENSPERDKKSVYSCNVVYGTPSDFQGDVLRTEFLGNDCRRNRKHQVIIVDEVDSMLFDSRTHSVRLADECPGMNHLEVPLAVIWEHIHNLTKHMISLDGKEYFIAEDFEVVPGQKIQLCSGGDWEEVSTIVEDKQKFITEHTEEHLRTLLRSLTDAEQKEYKEYQKKNLHILGKEEELSKKDEKDQEPFKDELKNLHHDQNGLPWNKRKPFIDIPEHLRSFAITQVPIWVKNAILAKWAYKKDAHYTVMDGRIVPVNFNETGDLQTNMIWSDGLTQFLQMKEGLRIDPEGVSTNFISNVSFFQRYGSKIYGLTGTLGEQSTQEFLHEMYGTDMVVIPPYKHIEIINNSMSSYRCKELAPLVFPKIGNWYNSVKENALYHAQNKRAVLVICKFISQVKHLYNMLSKVQKSSKLFIYTGAEADFQKETIDSGEIVIATNIAGRGTDFKTSTNVEKHGGLCVLVTFLPESFRVEMQNVGRTGREGKRGMAQLIVFDENITSMETLKELRHAQETQATAKAINDARKILIQDHLFQRFCELENEILPSYDEMRKSQDWSLLDASWTLYSYNKLATRKVEEKTTAWSKETSNRYYFTPLEKLRDDERSKLNEDDLQRLRENAAKQVEIEASDFSKRYQQNVLNSFVSKNSTGIAMELLELFKNGQISAIKRGKLAEQFGWTSHERKGAEESWGLWLKGKHFDDTDITGEQAMNSFTTDFEKPFQRRAHSDKLIQNPFFYVLKGNDMLEAYKIEEAIMCYDRAIDLDPVFAVNAHYNKAQALLSYSENKGCRQKEALEELNQAKNLIKTVYRPNLLTFNTLLAQHSCKEHTSQHVQHQLDILSKQEDFIENACQIISTAQKNSNNVKLTLKSLTETFADSQEDHKKAIREANINGLNKLFTVEEKLPRPWKEILMVAMLGIAQIAAGCLIVAYTGGAMGTGLIAEGVADLITAARSAITGSFSWAAWATQKVISLAVSIVCSGISTIKQTVKAAKQAKTLGFSTVKQAGSAVFKNFKSNFKDVSRTCYDIGQKIVAPTGGVSLAVKEVGLALGKGIVKECLTEAAKYCTDQLFMKDLENYITGMVGDALTTALSSNTLVIKALEDDEQKQSSYWKQRFIDQGMDLLKDKEINKTIEMFRNVAKGVATGSIPYAGEVMDVGGAAMCINKLETYTRNFIDRFNKEITKKHKEQIDQIEISSSHQADNRQSSASFVHLDQQQHVGQAPELDCDDAEIKVQQIDTETRYNSKVSSEAQAKLLSKFREASTPKTLANEFKRTIAIKLTTSIQESFVNPLTTRLTSHVTTGLFHNMEQSVAKLREEIKTERDLRSESNAMANETQHDSDESKELGPHTLERIDKMSSEDYVHDTTSLALSSGAIQAPIHVFDEKGNLKYIVGSKLPGKPIAIKHFPPSDKHPVGHFTPLNPNIEVTSSGRNTCALDAIVAQLDNSQRESLQIKSGTDLCSKMKEQAIVNPRQTEVMFEKRAYLEKIAPNRIVCGGRQDPKKDQTEKSKKSNAAKKERAKDYNKFNEDDSKYKDILGDDFEADSETLDDYEGALQKHHLIPQKIFKGKNLTKEEQKISEALKKSGFEMNELINIIFLPQSENEKTKRSRHSGRHTDYVMNELYDRLKAVANSTNDANELYKGFVREANKERKAVRRGKNLYERKDKQNGKSKKEKKMRKRPI